MRRAFLRRVDLNRLEDLAHLNRLLFAWIEGEYHTNPHRALDGETPIDRWLRLSEGIRALPREVDLDELFLEQSTRRVAKDGTFRLKGKVFEAGPTLIGERVTVLFDPFDLRCVLVRDKREKSLQAFPVDLYQNRRVRRNAPPEPEPTPEPPPLKALADLADDLEKRNDPQNEKETNHDGT